jgi:hypothetical protein
VAQETREKSERRFRRLLMFEGLCSRDLQTTPTIMMKAPRMIICGNEGGSRCQDEGWRRKKEKNDGGKRPLRRPNLLP